MKKDKEYKDLKGLLSNKKNNNNNNKIIIKKKQILNRKKVNKMANEKKNYPRRDSNPQPPTSHPDVVIHFATGDAVVKMFHFLLIMTSA